MASELKVYNQFREVILHVRFTSGDMPELLMIDGTDEMRLAMRSLVGQDFERNVAKGGEVLRFSAAWGSPEFGRVLAGYFSTNYSWSTKIIETEQPLQANTSSGAACYSLLLHFLDRAQANTSVHVWNIANLTTDDPRLRPLVQTEQKAIAQAVGSSSSLVSCRT